MSVPRIVTTSWDDGDPMDLRVAEFLRARKLPGTFYVPITGYRGRPTMNSADLRSLTSEGFEVGGHGFSHHSLSRLAGDELARDVGTCKKVLEDRVGREISMFCYPQGDYNSHIIRIVREAGFQGARTTRMLAFKMNFSPFEMPTTVQAFPHPKSSYFKNLATARTIAGLYDCIAQFKLLDTWIQLGKSFFDMVLREGGIWHLYGHSWETDELGLWDDLEEMLDYVSNREGVLYLSNRELLKFIPSHNQGVQESVLASSKSS
jgi:peptidoglycan-N-acetylglucosamine deacetylase